MKPIAILLTVALSSLAGPIVADDTHWDYEGSKGP